MTDEDTMRVRAILAGGALVLLACEVDSTDRGGEVAFDGGCSQFASCETCTPIDGCGWCFDRDGTGRCASGADACAGASALGWTWNPSGCRVAADAGTGRFEDAGLPVDPPFRGCGPLGGVVWVPIDGGALVDASMATGDASPAADASAPADATGPMADASPGAAPGCSIENPSGLCNPFQYQLRCMGAAPADETCSLLLAPTPPGEELYCCECYIESP
jgi:hypothetical protein